MRRQQERNSEILRLHRRGKSFAELAARFNITPGRARQIIVDNEGNERRRDQLARAYGARPSIEELPDATPVDVLVLHNVETRGWATFVRRLPFGRTPIKTLGDLRKVPNATLLREPHIGRRTLALLRSLCPHRRTTS